MLYVQTENMSHGLYPTVAEPELRELNKSFKGAGYCSRIGELWYPEEMKNL